MVPNNACGLHSFQEGVDNHQYVLPRIDSAELGSVRSNISGNKRNDRRGKGMRK